jgi:hypothetical protein
MVFANLRLAFMYELIVGIICVLGIVFNGEIMIILIAFMALRPVVLDRKRVRDLTLYWRLYFQTYKISIVIMGIILIIMTVLYQILGNTAVIVGLRSRVLLSVILPSFLVIHGIVGLNCLKQSGIR